jgi:hypothetical protein
MASVTGPSTPPVSIATVWAAASTVNGAGRPSIATAVMATSASSSIIGCARHAIVSCSWAVSVVVAQSKRAASV